MNLPSSARIFGSGEWWFALGKAKRTTGNAMTFKKRLVTRRLHRAEPSMPHPIAPPAAPRLTRGLRIAPPPTDIHRCDLVALGCEALTLPVPHMYSS
jgi:hypothetical protein